MAQDKKSRAIVIIVVGIIIVLAILFGRSFLNSSKFKGQLLYNEPFPSGAGQEATGIAPPNGLGKTGTGGEFATGSGGSEATGIGPGGGSSGSGLGADTGVNYGTSDTGSGLKSAGSGGSEDTGSAPTNQLCGNGKKEGSEDCDDGNTIDGDQCPWNCKFVLFY